MVGGGALGLIAGSLLCAPLLAYVAGPTTVTWNVSACPAGTYSITSTATSQDGSQSFTTTSNDVQFPREVVEQEFRDLPAGQYSVSAVLTDSDGQTIESAPKLLTSLGGPRIPPTPHLPTIPKRVLSSPAPVRTTAARPAPNLPPAHSAAVPSTSVRLPPAMLELLESEALQADAGAHPLWNRVVLIDADDDGVMDTVRIEWITGEVWVATFGK
jgi:hypothetical protein